MPRYTSVQSVSFGAVTLSLPLSVRVTRKVAPAPAAGDDDAFTTSVQTSAATVLIEVRTRDVAAAAALAPGEQAALTLTSGPTESGQAGRVVTLGGAVLTVIELNYDQSAMAVATLHFVAEADDGDTDPFTAEDES